MRFTAVLKGDDDLIVKDFTLSNSEYEVISAVVDFIKSHEYGEVTVSRNDKFLETLTSLKVNTDPITAMKEFMAHTKYGELRIKKQLEGVYPTIFNRNRYTE